MSSATNKNIGWCLPSVLQLGSCSGHCISTDGIAKHEIVMSSLMLTWHLFVRNRQIHVQVEFWDMLSMFVSPSLVYNWMYTSATISFYSMTPFDALCFSILRLTFRYAFQ